MNRRRAAAIFIMAILALTVIMLVRKAGTADRERDSADDGTIDVNMLRPDERESTENTEPVMISIDEEEKIRIREMILEAVESCKDIYQSADKGTADNVVLKEEDMHRLVNCLADQGYTSACSANDFNMRNEEVLDDVLRQAEQGGTVSAGFFTVTKSGTFEWRQLEFDDGVLVMTYASAVWEKGREANLSYIEKVRMYDWSYTEKGWFIMEKAKSKNHELDMHSMFRVLPLSEECREYCRKYIEPVKYKGNNLFLTEWSEEFMEPIVFNDVFDFLYEIDYGHPYDDIQSPGKVPAALYEAVITSWFPISADRLEQMPGYNGEENSYDWAAVGSWNISHHFQQQPEVVEVRHNPDGTVTLEVDAVYVLEGQDKAFTHEVTMRPDENGHMKYVSNHILEDGKEHISDYKPRMDYK